MAWLCIHNQHGKNYFSLYMFQPPIKPNEYELGTRKYIPLTDKETALALKDLDSLIFIYKTKQEILDEQQRVNKEEVAKIQKAKEAHNDLVNRIIRIINESTQPGEVESAKGFYLKITGKPWKG